jgi:CubicO group peptidase (beta-lactamase class C family)
VGFEHDATFLMDNSESQRELAFGTISATTRDFARFGWLFMNRGRSFDGQQVVSESYVKQSVTPGAAHVMPNAHSKNLSSSLFFGYGFQWWIGPQVRVEPCLVNQMLT